MKRWKTFTGLLAGAVIAVASVTAQANDGNHASDGSSMDDPFIQECQEWATYFWQWYETGMVPPGADEFEFSFEVDDGMNPLLPTLVLFEQIYADELSPDYTIWNLIEDDSAVYLAFKIHSVSGVNIMRAGLVGKDKKRPDLIPEIPLPKGCDHIQDEALREFCEKLHEVFHAADFQPFCYKADSKWPWGKPGFDCDDYADAMRWFLWHHLSEQYPEIEVFTLALYFGRSGHAVTALHFNGQYWFMDPQTGEIYGPFSNWEALEAAVRSFMKAQDMYTWPRRIKKRTTPPWNEPGYWYTDPDRRQEIADCFGWEDPGLYFPPDYPTNE
ncbi:MAG: hypothetical protein VX527_07960 [Planctomycetota bacterium]|nr:hypothetical protein [Planctomycetota bacterium]